MRSPSIASMRIKQLFTYFILAALTLTLTVSCRTSQTQPTASPQAEISSGSKVAMILSGSKNDESWSQGGYEGLKLIEATYKSQTAYQEYINEADAEAAIEQYAKEGYDLIIAHSGGYIPATETVAKQFPRTKFAIVSSYAGNNQNLGAVAFRSGEVGYLTGLLAAMKTKTNKVAYLVGADYPVYQEEAALFIRGAKATNPAVEVSTHFLQTWTDGEKASKTALDLVAQGVDILAINADEAGVAAIKAVTQKDGVYVIGWTKDQHEVAPGRVLTSVLQDIPALILNAATLVQQGRWEGKLYKFGLKEKIYDFSPFNGLLTAEEEAKFKLAKDNVVTGKVDVSP